MARRSEHPPLLLCPRDIVSARELPGLQLRAPASPPQPHRRTPTSQLGTLPRPRPALRQARGRESRTLALLQVPPPPHAAPALFAHLQIHPSGACRAGPSGDVGYDMLGHRGGHHPGDDGRLRVVGLAQTGRQDRRVRAPICVSKIDTTSRTTQALVRPPPGVGARRPRRSAATVPACLVNARRFADRPRCAVGG